MLNSQQFGIEFDIVVIKQWKNAAYRKIYCLVIVGYEPIKARKKTSYEANEIKPSKYEEGISLLLVEYAAI